MGGKGSGVVGGELKKYRGLTPDEIVDIFESIGIFVTTRSIYNWVSGKSSPNKTNKAILDRVVKGVNHDKE